MKIEYELIKEHEKEFPVKELIKIPGVLTGTRKSFGPNYFPKNVAEMKKQYSHPLTGEIISFREPTTRESIFLAGCDFETFAKPEIFDPRWLQTGWVVRASEGVYINPPKNSEGNPINDEKILKLLLNGIKKSNGIYLVGTKVVPLEDSNLILRDFAFVPHKTFEQGVQSSEDFARSGLARGLEFSLDKTAPILKDISSKENYQNGVNVFGWDSSTDPLVRLSELNSNGDQLNVDGDDWNDDGYGHAFGILDEN